MRSGSEGPRDPHQALKDQAEAAALVDEATELRMKAANEEPEGSAADGEEEGAAVPKKPFAKKKGQ